MGEIAERLKGKRKSKAVQPKQEKAAEPADPQDPSAETELPPESLALRQEAKKAQLVFACISYETAQRTCHWCCEQQPSQYDLTFASPFGKFKFCSKECQSKWYSWAGRKYKKTDDSLIEWGIDDASVAFDASV